jgi:isopentenyl diphosphate isomerase/L-lactate dehydrogenase-like FMN-dependent dehydrogenase
VERITTAAIIGKSVVLVDRHETGLPVIVKGIWTPETAMEAVKHRCAGVRVSNHGGRAIDNTFPSVSALPPIADAEAGE